MTIRISLPHVNASDVRIVLQSFTKYKTNMFCNSANFSIVPVAPLEMMVKFLKERGAGDDCNIPPDKYSEQVCTVQGMQNTHK